MSLMNGDVKFSLNNAKNEFKFECAFINLLIFV